MEEQELRLKYFPISFFSIFLFFFRITQAEITSSQPIKGFFVFVNIAPYEKYEFYLLNKEIYSATNSIITADFQKEKKLYFIFPIKNEGSFMLYKIKIGKTVFLLFPPYTFSNKIKKKGICYFGHIFIEMLGDFSYLHIKDKFYEGKQLFFKENGIGKRVLNCFSKEKEYAL
jgi:hypothetical protein